MVLRRALESRDGPVAVHDLRQKANLKVLAARDFFRIAAQGRDILIDVVR